MDGPVRWGIAGFGWVAQDFMAPAIIAAGQQLVAICDPDEAARARAAALGVGRYAGIEGLAADPSIEAVYVATPNHLHRPMVEALAACGKAVLCEKPMAATLADAESIAAVCRTAGILYGTAFDQRHHPAHRALRDAVRQGMVGTVTVLRLVYACWLGEDWSKDTGDNWRVDTGKAGGGATMDLAPHGIDLIDYLLDEPILELRGLMQRRVHGYAVDDGGVLIGQTASGVLVSLHIAYNCPETLPRRRLEVLGTAGQIVATDTMGQDPGGTLIFSDAKTGTSRALEVPEADQSPFTNQVRAFSNAVRNGRHEEYSLERDLHTMRLLDGVYRLDEARHKRQPAPVTSRRLVAVPTPLF